MLLVFVAAVMLFEMFKHELKKRQCSYCGGLNGHQQDCPLDHLDQNGGT